MKKSNIKSLDIYKLLSDNNYRLTKIGCGVTAVALTATLVGGSLFGHKNTRIPSSIEYTVEAGDTLTSIANEIGVTINNIVFNSNLSDVNNIVPGQKLYIKTGAIFTPNIKEYTVQSGDSLTSIAESFGVTIDSVIKYNNIENPDYIEVGRKLIINEYLKQEDAKLVKRLNNN